MENSFTQETDEGKSSWRGGSRRIRLVGAQVFRPEYCDWQLSGRDAPVCGELTVSPQQLQSGIYRASRVIRECVSKKQNVELGRALTDPFREST